MTVVYIFGKKEITLRSTVQKKKNSSHVDFETRLLGNRECQLFEWSKA